MDEKINIFLKNGYDKEITAKSGIIIKELLKYVDTTQYKFIAAKVNNEITSLSYSLKVNSTVEFITIKDQDGMEVYRRSLSFLLEKVVNKIFPDRRLIIGHSLGPGYYFEITGSVLTEQEVALIEEKMHQEVKEDKIIVREMITYTEALEYFKTKGRDDKYKLIAELNMSKLPIYKCDDFFQVVDLPLSGSTGILKVFSLNFYPPGFILQFPKKSDTDKTSEFVEQRKIFEVYQKYREWGKILNIDNVGSLNQMIVNQKIYNFIQIVEALHTKKIVYLADEIAGRKNEIKLISIAGPSSSGKTTFSKRLAIHLQACGIKPVTISVDNYFVDRDKTPLDEKGNPDFETIEAINIDLLNEHLADLMNGKSINTVSYNFHTGKSTINNDSFSISKDDILVIEGIHCLNEKLTYVIPKKNKYKIYVSVLTQMNMDNNNRIPTTDNRILRRIIRDFKYRGHSALKTLQMWPSVRNGEEKFIFPYQNDADGYFNSALDYELAILKTYAEPLLMQVKPYDKEYSEAKRLLKFLSYFLPLLSKEVPSISILKEFIGDSFFHY